MQCIKCGTELPDVAAYCFACGTPQKALRKRTEAETTTNIEAFELLKKADPQGELVTYIERYTGGLPEPPPDFGALVVWCAPKIAAVSWMKVYLKSIDDSFIDYESVGGRSDQETYKWRINGEEVGAALFPKLIPNVYRVDFPGQHQDVVEIKAGEIAVIDFTWVTFSWIT